jgi:GNAT superfamily N-acetyltransferase
MTMPDAAPRPPAPHPPGPRPPAPWRRATQGDVPDMIAIAAIVHTGFPEGACVLAERITLHPEGCFVLDAPAGVRPAATGPTDTGVTDKRVRGYLLSHPWRAGDAPKLNRRLGALPPAPDAYYIHDLALHPAAQGSGAAGAIVAHLLAVTAGWRLHALVAVNRSAPFWARHGFAVTPGLDLSSYGPDAHYMTRRA